MLWLPWHLDMRDRSSTGRPGYPVQRLGPWRSPACAPSVAGVGGSPFRRPSPFAVAWAHDPGRPLDLDGPEGACYLR